MKKVSDKIPNKEIDTSNFYRYPIIDQTPIVEENITDWSDVIFDEQQEDIKTKLKKDREKIEKDFNKLKLQEMMRESNMNVQALIRSFINEQPSNNSTIDVLLKLAESVGPIIGNMIVNNNNDGKLRLTGVYKGDKIDVELQNNKFMIMMVMTMLGEILQQIELVEKSEKSPTTSQKIQELKELKERINYEFMKKQYMDELKKLG